MQNIYRCNKKKVEKRRQDITINYKFNKKLKMKLLKKMGVGTYE